MPPFRYHNSIILLYAWANIQEEEEEEEKEEEYK